MSKLSSSSSSAPAPPPPPSPLDRAAAARARGATDRGARGAPLAAERAGAVVLAADQIVHERVDRVGRAPRDALDRVGAPVVEHARPADEQRLGDGVGVEPARRAQQVPHERARERRVSGRHLK